MRVAKAGVGPLLSGSMGEAHHLTHSERITLIRSARAALDAAGLQEVPIVAGVGAGATREVVQYGKEAAEAGADATIAILSGYFAGALTNDRKALKAFWAEVSEKSSVPVIIYNCTSSPLCGGACFKPPVSFSITRMLTLFTCPSQTLELLGVSI